MNEVISEWFKDQNRATAALRWLWLVPAGFSSAVGMALFTDVEPLYVFLTAIVPALVWHFFAPKPVWKGAPHEAVPDSLLSKIADSDLVSPKEKEQLADYLHRYGFVPYELLNDIEHARWQATDLMQRSQRPGYRKLIAYSNQRYEGSPTDLQRHENQVSGDLGAVGGIPPR